MVLCVHNYLAISRYMGVLVTQQKHSVCLFRDIWITTLPNAFTLRSYLAIFLVIALLNGSLSYLLINYLHLGNTVTE